MTTGEKITTLRKEKGISQEALAEKLAVSRQAVSKWENDTAVPTTENLVQLSKIFDTNIDFFLTDKAKQVTRTENSSAPYGYNGRSIRTLAAIVTLLVVSVVFLRYKSVVYKIEIDYLNTRIDTLNNKATQDILYYFDNINRLSTSKDWELFDIIPANYDLENGTVDIKVIYKPEKYNTDDEVSIVLENGYTTYSKQATLEGDRYVAVLHIDDVYSSCQLYVMKTNGTEILKTKTTLEVNPYKYILPHIIERESSMIKSSRKITDMRLDFVIDYRPENPPTKLTYTVTDNGCNTVYYQGEIELNLKKATKGKIDYADGTEKEMNCYVVTYTEALGELPEHYVTVNLMVYDSYGRATGSQLSFCVK